MAFPGLSINGFTNSAERRHRLLHARALRQARARRRSPARDRGKRSTAQLDVDPGRVCRGLPAAAGAGPGHDRRLQAAARGPRRARLRGAVRRRARPSCRRPTRRRSSPACSRATRSTCRSCTPTSTASRPSRLGVSVTDVFDTMQVYLGSLYVNDFNRFGRTYQVKVQADAPFRANADDMLQAEDAQRARRDGAAVGAAAGQPDLRARPRHALQRLPRRRHQRRPGTGLSARARRRPRSSASPLKTLPNGIGFEWTELTYQEILAGNSGIAGVPAGGAAGVPGAGGAVRELDAAAGGDPDRADGAAVGARRRLADRAATTTSSRRSRWSCWSGWRARTRS